MPLLHPLKHPEVTWHQQGRVRIRDGEAEQVQRVRHIPRSRGEPGHARGREPQDRLQLHAPGERDHATSMGVLGGNTQLPARRALLPTKSKAPGICERPRMWRPSGFGCRDRSSAPAPQTPLFLLVRCSRWRGWGPPRWYGPHRSICDGAWKTRGSGSSAGRYTISLPSSLRKRYPRIRLSSYLLLVYAMVQQKLLLRLIRAQHCFHHQQVLPTGRAHLSEPAPREEEQAKPALCASKRHLH